MSDDQETRFVPVTKAQRDEIAWTEAFTEIVAAWDAAPEAPKDIGILQSEELARLREALQRIAGAVVMSMPIEAHRDCVSLAREVLGEDET